MNAEQRLVGVHPSRTRRSRCPGSRRCCCRPACARSRRRRTASARPARETASPGSCACWRCRRRRTSGLSVGPLDAAVPRAIVALAVAVVLAVRLVVLLVVRHEIVQREAVVRGDEVDAGVGPPGRALVEVGAAGESRTELRERLIGTAPEVAHRIAVLAVPFRPERREVADLVAAFADIPRLGDQLYPVDDRILLDQIEERSEPIDVVQLARERRREVEAEPVHVHLEHPVAQAVHQQLQHVRVHHVQGVAGAGVVHVVAAVVRHRPVVGRVVDPLERQHRPKMIAFGGVVVDHVENDFDAGRCRALTAPLNSRTCSPRVPEQAYRCAARSSRWSYSPSSCEARDRAAASPAQTGEPAAARPP